MKQNSFFECQKCFEEIILSTFCKSCDHVDCHLYEIYYSIFFFAFMCFELWAKKFYSNYKREKLVNPKK